jgi:hypothetical protein
MQRIGDYDYPNLGTFSDAIMLAQEALSKYAGIIPNIDAVGKLGYTVKNPAAISGPIYKRINDLVAFGLFTRDRGALRTTDLAAEALDQNDSTKASIGKAKAIRNIEIIGKAFDAWEGKIPDNTAFPGKLMQITGVSLSEAQKHMESLKKLFNETFHYLGVTPGMPTPLGEAALATERRDNGMVQSVSTEAPVTVEPRGEMRSTIGTIIVKDKTTWRIARDLLRALGEQLGLSEEDME